MVRSLFPTVYCKHVNEGTMRPVCTVGGPPKAGTHLQRCQYHLHAYPTRITCRNLRILNANKSLSMQMPMPHGFSAKENRRGLREPPWGPSAGLLALRYQVRGTHVIISNSFKTGEWDHKACFAPHPRLAGAKQEPIVGNWGLSCPSSGHKYGVIK